MIPVAKPSLGFLSFFVHSLSANRIPGWLFCGQSRVATVAKSALTGRIVIRYVSAGVVVCYFVSLRGWTTDTNGLDQPSQPWEHCSQGLRSMIKTDTRLLE